MREILPFLHALISNKVGENSSIDSALGDAVKVAAAEDTILEHIQKANTGHIQLLFKALILFLFH